VCGRYNECWRVEGGKICVDSIIVGFGRLLEAGKPRRSPRWVIKGINHLFVRYANAMRQYASSIPP